ncbi:hypothetical protein B484DRAFT_457251 [Ochromonadaceae sp. CCMP2298]|nr:hypothetical protein B484DRAFT_457251 [Ochromonadaceae sp. CCMP2298]
MAFAQDAPTFQAWDTKLVYGLTAEMLVREHQCPSEECWLRGELEGDRGDRDRGDGDRGDKGDDKGGGDEQWTVVWFQPCVHTPIGEWVRLYEENVRHSVSRGFNRSHCNVSLELNIGRYESVHGENFAIRALLHGLLEAMGKHGYMYVWVYEYMGIYLYMYICIWVYGYGYMGIWIYPYKYGYIGIWIYG